ncbi:MAG: tRNA epoxyqueuosine(34) reductase QueG [Anaerolineaceae bacterium]|nr:tRNA epoxyqueuosine(34) reductase QueG [Anaerolineaceae bacterium]
MSIKDQIQAEAHSLGFSLFGITTIQKPAHFPLYEQWIVNGYHGGMSYLATSRALLYRSNPEMILPEAKSIIVLGMPYPNHPEDKNDFAFPVGKIASYAWIDDYHNTIPDLLHTLIQKIESVSRRNILYKIYTDTGPILERELAQMAGLGWIGRNSNLISPTHGSNIFLAEIFCDLTLEFDVPFHADRCGKCQRCIHACPTQAILPDRTIDSNRCISYLTIENKGIIPRRLRPSIGNWIFGCDICQTICPWNTPSKVERYTPTLGFQKKRFFPDLHKEILLTTAEFKQKFKNNPVNRARRRGYLRNVAVAIGNLAQPDSVPYLKKVLQDEAEPLICQHAAWALGRINNTTARKVLFQRTREEENQVVLEELIYALEHQVGET